ncbi:uncharacterized protein THITE_2120646 [Thermothielavioides terrestris NRRL 8126]|uniref:Fucose-specific lectin n=1 Tax=Thermothielavioides terrestris (strain ATCC 38088 / NRRL 8126) TaxID=578455 RepID=G2RD47_THETT|nr:uncharacterized protein THITE_2120646 [Thermothielavioides terrestris NRRL 8126]AEO69882.1 hypothetical protein THITE_2120646 [Thermothielavioides terrestris NRRL 8126]
MAAYHGESQLGYSNLEPVPLDNNHWNIQMGNGLEAVQRYGNHDKHVVSTGTDKILIQAHPTAPEVVAAGGSLPHVPRRTICGMGQRTFWVVAGVVGFILLAAAIGGGVGGSLSRHSQPSSSLAAASTASTGTSTGSPAPTPTRVPFQNLSIAAARWVDGDSITHYRVYTLSGNSSQTRILESARDQDDGDWTVSAITDVNVDTVQAGTPLSVSVGYPHTNTSKVPVRSVYYLQPGGTIIERQTPYKEAVGVWGDDNFSGLYAASNGSSLFSYWYQDLDQHLQVLATFFQELGVNELTIGRYVENGTNGQPWTSSRKSIPIQDGSSIAAVPAGDGQDIRLYVGGSDGTIKQFAYNLEDDVLGNVVGRSRPALS